MKSRVSRRYLYTQVHSNVIRSSRRLEASQPSTDGWMATQSTGEYYSAVKKEMPTQAITRMHLEDLTLSEINQSQKDK